ncbi:MAG: hypothetical protein LAO79_03455 [Acidobacteriia bacterium]|nr:hypothetical protein [Terriglobia bacterium]
MNSLRAVGLAVILTSSAAMAAIDPGLLNLVAPDAKVLSGLQVDQAIVSPFGQYILNRMQPNDPGFLTFMATTGFDPRHDLREMLAATSANNSALVVGRGTFQVAQIIAAATAKGGTITLYNTVSIITGPDQGSKGAVAFLDGSTVAIGDLASVKGAIDRRGASTAGVDPALAQSANTASTTNQAWFATTTPLSDFLNGKLTNPNLNNLSQNNLFQSILQASGGVNLATGGVVITGDATTASTQNAQSLVDVLKFLVSMVPVDNQQIKSLADAATFSANGVVAHLTLSLTEQQAEQLFTSVPKQAATARRH